LVVIFKPTLRCNIKCAHCYVGDAALDYSDMTVEAAKGILNKFPKAEVVLHGGEPTLMGAGFYEEIARDMLDRHTFSMQTNLTLLDAGWIPFIREILRNRLSTSFDVYRSLRPIDKTSWIERIDLLKRNDIFPYVVSMLWKCNQDRAEDIYDFFSALGLSFRLNYVENMGYATRNGFESLRHEDMKYAESVKAIFDMWFMNPQAEILVDPCAEVLSFMLLGNSVRKCPFTAGCFAHILSVNPNGDVYPCGGFDGFKSFRYGNLLIQSLSEITSSQGYMESGQRYLKLPDHCRTCRFFCFCEGGCRLEAWSYYGDIYRETSMCDEYKAIFSHIESRMNSEKGDIEDWWISLLRKRQTYRTGS